jgi:Protein of unknown function (DUF2950)
VVADVAVAAADAVVVADVDAKGDMMKPNMNRRTLVSIAAGVAIVLGALPVAAADTAAKQGTTTKAKAAPQTQASYASLEAAAKALYGAIKSQNVKSIYKVLGPGSENLIYTGDEVADRQMRERFIAAYDKSIKIELEGDMKATLLTGENEWPFPFPLVKGAKGWQFDAKAGAEEMVNRRIGENELFAITFCLAYGDAQREYAEHDRNGDGFLEYAQQFRSSEGKHDGLYWATKEGEPASPLGPLAAQAKREGYTSKDPGPTPYHGYYYRILTGQGKDAPGGAYDYMVKGKMIGGYALLAYPARWGASGVMSFICNHDGVVYQKNLGADTDKLAARVTLFNPDASWTKVAQ